MKIQLLKKLFFLSILSILLGTVTSCKKEEMVAFTGSVVSVNNTKIAGATVEIFKNSEDWLTGHNVVATLKTDLVGRFESAAIFEPGQYYIFIEKYDSSNWELQQVEQGVYPKINLPEDKELIHTIEFNNMSAMSQTSWELTNVLREYTKPGATATEWQSIWSSINNCKRDDKMVFHKDLSMQFSEGTTICKENEGDVIANFVPPLIFDIQGCETLPFTKVGVKEFNYSNWPEMEAKGAKMYLSCDQSIGQTYIYYMGENDLMVLEVYSRS